MKLQELLNNENENVMYTFTIAEYVEVTGNYGRTVYTQTPLRVVWEWMKSGIVDKYIVINKSHPPIDITGHWINNYNNDYLKNCILTTEQDLIKQYGEEQGKRMIEYYDKKVRNDR